jgi:hypothetical protein
LISYLFLFIYFESGSCYIALVGLEVGDPLASTSQLLGSQACATILSRNVTFLRSSYVTFVKVCQAVHLKWVIFIDSKLYLNKADFQVFGLKSSNAVVATVIHNPFTSLGSLVPFLFLA